MTIACMALHSLFSLSRTLLAKYLLDGVLLKPNSTTSHGFSQFELLMILSAVAAILAVLISLSKFGNMYLQDYLNTRVVVDIQKEVFNHLITLSMRFFNKRKMGDLLSRLTSDMGSVGVALRSLYGDFFLQPFMVVSGMCACLYFSWQLSIITFLIFPGIVIPIVRFGKTIHRRARRRQVSIAEMTQEMQQVFSGMRVIKSFGAEDFQKREYGEKNEVYFKKAMKVFKTKAVAKSFVEFLNNIGLPFIMGVGGYFILQGGFAITPGDLVAFLAATGLMYEPLKTLSRSYNIFQESLAGVSRIFELVEEKPEIIDGSEAEPLEAIREGLAFEGVTFGYEGENRVLKNLSFSVKLGEVVAIVGPSGAGKSTLLDLILRFYDPQEGSIKVDGRDIRSFTLKSYLEKIAVVNQDPYLFHKTIRENILFGKEGASEEEIINAAKAANIHDFIMTLPQGYDTLVGERGVMISGGQRQRITIARAVLKDYSILLLDEATSSLDTESERLVQDALEILMENHTTFIVAHRLSTIQNAHKIVLLEEGKLVDMGTHEELLERAPLYQKLYKMQFSGSKSED